MSENKTTSCNRCEHLMERWEGYVCGITCGKLESISTQPEWCPLNRNCHNYCRYAKQCRYLDGGNGVNPEECPMFYKIEDIMMEARDIYKEQKRSAGIEDGDDW